MCLHGVCKELAALFIISGKIGERRSGRANIYAGNVKMEFPQ